MPRQHHTLNRLLLFALLISMVFGFILKDLTDYSFWMDEGFTAWIVRDDMREPETVRETLRYVRDSLLNTLNYVQDDVHPPLYYLLMDVWALLTGDSEFTLRLPSALSAILSLAGAYAIGRQWFNTKTAIISVLIFGTAGFYMYYAREARMYSLYLALATLSTWLYSRWWHHPTIARGILYGIVLALMLYTHYTAFTIILAHGLHALISVRQWTKQSAVWQIFIPYGMTALLFALWIPVLLRQLDINTGFSAPGALPSDAGTAMALWLKLTYGYTLIFVLTLILSRRIITLHKHYHALLLLLLWGFVPVVALFAINASGFSILQLRYLIPVVPVWSLIVAYLLSEMGIPFVGNQRIGLILTAFFTGWIAYTGLATYHIHWQEKPDWRGTVSRADVARDVSEPGVVYLDLRSPLVYYAYQTGLLDAISINVSWREFAPQEVHRIADSLKNSPVVWGIVAMQAPESWDTIASLSANRGVSYRDAVQWSVFYQFDRDSDESLDFRFGTAHDTPLLAYRGEFYTRYPADTGDTVCVPVQLEALADIPDTYAITLHLTRGYNEVVAQVDEALGAHPTGSIIEREYCLTKPDEDDFHLRLILYHTQTLAPLYVLEQDFVWGQYLMRGTIEQITED